MCYNCNGPSCNACGKYDSDIFGASFRPVIECLACGSPVDEQTHICKSCGMPAFAAPGQRL